VIPVRFTPTAARQLAARRNWWRQNREKAPDLFDRELDEAVEKLAVSARSLPIFAELAGHSVRRYRMPKSRCHLYFEVIKSPGEVRVLAAGGSQRRRPPKIRLQDEP
jgi:hypothetical protein